MMLSLAATVALVLSASQVESDSERIQDGFRVTDIGPSLTVVADTDYGTNIGLFEKDGAILLIDPMPGEERLVALAELIKDSASGQVDCILNTHNHEDHSGGNAFFAANGAAIAEVSLEVCNAVFSESVKLITVQSHTDEDILVFVPEANTLFVGDVFDNSWHPTFYAGGLPGLNQAIDIIVDLANDDALIVPGHGRPAKADVVIQFRDNTVEWVALIKRLHEAGMTVEQIMNVPEVELALQRFNTERRDPFIPQRAYLRFVERTVEIISG